MSRRNDLPGAQTTCLETCELESDCPADSFCGRGQNDAGVCQKQPLFLEPVPTTQPAAPKTGCSATTGLELGLAALFLTMRRFRSR